MNPTDIPPGTLLGWVIRYGDRWQHRTFVHAAEGRTHADQRAAALHGVITVAVAG